MDPPFEFEMWTEPPETLITDTPPEEMLTHWYGIVGVADEDR